MEPIRSLDNALEERAPENLSDPHPSQLAAPSSLSLQQIEMLLRPLQGLHKKELPIKEVLLLKQQAILALASIDGETEQIKTLLAKVQSTQEPLIREVALLTLSKCSHSEVERAFTFEQLMSAIAILGYDKEAHRKGEQLMEQLLPFAPQEEYAKRMFDYLMVGRHGLLWVAQPLRHSSLAIQEEIRHRLITALDQPTQLEHLWALPFALDPKNPETKKFFIENIRDFPKKGKFVSALLKVIGEVEDPTLTPYLFHHFISPDFSAHGWMKQLWAMDSLKKRLNNTLVEKITLFLESSPPKSAWILAGLQGFSGIAQVRQAMNLYTSVRTSLEDKRVLAALLLKESNPELCHRTLKGLVSVQPPRCHSFALQTAEEELRSMASPLSS